jgi:DNA invertase Pin-like site-specific DNA recombinase
MPPENLIPAAEYVRMSTEEQPNSIILQQAAIRRYAKAHGYQVVLTYADPGKSGIEIRHRPGLRQLIQDVVGGQKQFRVILVFDVSRWGRFQDTDESAHYEFLCRSEGVAVHYCEEQFENNGTLPNEMMKALKRAMAAEYSRQLAVKARGGMQWLASHGFRLGSTPGYGLRRLLVSSDGRRKQILKPHERKYLKSDRIVLVPGPQREVEVIRTIFALATKRQNSPRRIAAELNRRGIKYLDGKPWNKIAVYLILKNEKYMGSSVWGKTQRPFNRFTRKVPPGAWIKKGDAFVPLVGAEQFARVQRIIRDRNRHLARADEYFLRAMKKVLDKDGTLTGRLLNKRLHFHESVYLKRFGSLMRAYELIGYKPSSRAIRGLERMKRTIHLKTRLLAQLKELFPSLHIVRGPGHRQREILEFDRGLQVSVHICRPLAPTVHGKPRWVLRAQPKEQSMPALLCLPNQDLTELRTIYVVRELGNLFRKYKNLREGHPLLTNAKHLDSLGQVHEVVNELLKQAQLGGDQRWGDVVLGDRTSTVRIGRKRIFLSPIQSALLKLLVSNAGHIVSATELCRLIHGNNESLRNRVADLRKKLGPRFRKRIVTIKHVGVMYRATPRKTNTS